MADRVSATITIGGALAQAKLPELLDEITAEGLATDWDGEPFTLDELPTDAPLRLMAHEVAWGRFEELEAFCVREALAFTRWSGAYSGQWGAERVVYTGTGEPHSYAANDEDEIVIDRAGVEQLGSFADVLAHFAAADVAIPPLTVLPGNLVRRASPNERGGSLRPS